MADWGTNGNANRIKDTYIKGFLDISGGSVIVEKTSTLKIMSHDSDHPVIEFKPEYFTVNTTSAFDVSYSSLATLGLLGISFEQSTVETAGRIKYITTGTSGAPPNEVFYTEIGNDDEKSQLQVYGLIKGHYGLDIDGDVSFNNNLFVKNDLSLNGNISIGRDLSLNGNMYVSRRSVFTLDVSMNSNLDIGNGSSCLVVNKDISAGYALDVSGLTMLRNKLNVISDVSFNRNTQLGLGTNSVAINKDISNGIALDVSGATIFRGGMDLFGAFTVNGQPVNGSGIIVNLTVTNDSSLNGKLSVGGDVSMNGNIRLGNSVAINKDISAGYALDVSGLTLLRNTLNVIRDVSLNANFFVGIDSSLNGNVSVGRDLSLNGNLYVSRRALILGDVSMNGNTRLGTGSNSVAINKDVTAGYALDVSGLTILRNTMYVSGDVSLNNSLFVSIDSSLNGNVSVGRDLSLNGNLYVSRRALILGDVSMNGNTRLGTGSNLVAINKDVTAGYALDVSGLTILRNTLNVIRDVSLNANFFVGIDSSLNGNVFVGRDLSLNGNLYVSRRSVFTLDVSMNGNLDVGSGSSCLVVNKDISAGYALDVSGLTIFRNTLNVIRDVSLNANFFVGIDSSLNGNVSVGRDLSLNGNLYVSRRALFLGDVSMNANTRLGTGSNSVAINKDITAGYALDVSGLMILRNTLYVSGDVSLNANFFVTIDSSLNGNVSVGRDLSLNGNLYVSRRALFLGDVSMNGNTRLGTGSNSVAINKDVTAGYALDVSGLTLLRNTMYVSGDVSLNSNLFVGIDSSLNGNVSVGRDLSLNGNLYVSRRALILGDVSMNANTRLGTGSNSVAINKDVTAGYALDVSGLTILRNTMFVSGDVSLNSNFFVSIDSSLNGNVSVGRDLSLNGNLYVSRRALFLGDVSLNGNTRLGNSVAINKDISAGYALDVSGLTILRNTLYISGDVSLNSNFFVSIDSSLNGNVSVGRDLSMNGNLYVSRRALFLGDVSMNANTRLGNSVAINKDISAGYALDVSGLTLLRNTLYISGDVSLNANLFVAIDSSLNGNVSVGRDLSLNGNLYVSRRALILGDVSMNGNTRLGTGFNSVAINKDISGVFALDVSGTTKIRGSLDVSGVFTVNGAPVSGGGVSLTGNVQVGSNSGFVTVDKPQFFSDPSLTIFYDFDTSYNTTRIQNMASITGLYDGSMNGVTTGLIIIDPNNPKYGTASLRNTPASGGKGISIGAINTSIPVSSTMSFSLWVRKPNKPVSPDWDRIFEFSDYTAISSVPGQHNNTIALDISADGFVYPKITYSGPSNNSCFATLSSPNNFYNLGNGLWNHILWIINSNKSFIYINGSLTQSDNITNFPGASTRASGFIAYSYVLGDVNYGNDFSGNIDDFRYYNGKALNYAEIYQLYNNRFYTLDVCGGFLANGSSVIYEPVGSTAGANSGSLTLLHGDASGSSSIMFKSVNDPLDYAYIEYDENVTGSTGLNYGLMTIGIENDAGSTTTQADRLSLFPSGGQGFVGVNTKTPLYSLDVSGTLNTNADASMNGVSVGRGSGNLASNTAVGFQALKTNTSGTNNVALGYQALTQNTSNNNTAVGYQALQINTNVNNTAVGFQSLFANAGGSSNIAVGSYALYNNDTGINNTAIGYNAGYNTSVGSYNTYLGSDTSMNGSYNNSTAVGYKALITASNTVQLGNATCTAQATSFNATSDYREKDNVMELNETFTVDVLRPVVYDFKPLGKKHIGFIAHEVQEFYPFLVSGEKDGPASQSMNYNGFIGILTKEIQVLKKKVAEQEAKSAEQETRISEQEAKSAEQETRISEQEAKSAEQDQRISALEKMVSNLINK